MTNKSNEILISDNIISNDIQANDEISREDDTVVISTHDTNVEQPIKKKRGRKPKSKLEKPKPKEKLILKKAGIIGLSVPLLASPLGQCQLFLLTSPKWLD